MERKLKSFMSGPSRFKVEQDVNELDSEIGIDVVSIVWNGDGMFIVFYYEKAD